MVVGGWGFVQLYLSGTFLRSVPLTVPKSLALWLAIHGTIALATLLGSSLVLLTRKIGEKTKTNPVGFRARFNARHRFYGWIFVLLWVFTHVGGVVNLYIIG